MKRGISKWVVVLVITSFTMSAQGQIDEDFYGSRYNLSIMHSSIRAKNSLETGQNRFTSLHMFDFSFGESEMWDSYFEGNMRVVSDIWWMLGKEIGGVTNYLNDGYLGSVFEIKWGLNVMSADRLTLTPALATNSYWYAFDGHREWTWCLGPMLKVDFLLLDNLMLRSFTGIDFPFTRSSGSLGGSSTYYYQRAELITRKGLMFGIDYAHGSLRSSSNSLLPPSNATRFDYRLGWRIRM